MDEAAFLLLDQAAGAAAEEHEDKIEFAVGREGASASVEAPSLLEIAAIVLLLAGGLLGIWLVRRRFR